MTKKALIAFAAGRLAAFVVMLTGAAEAQAQKPPLLPEKDVAALANELSGETLEGWKVQRLRS